MSRVRCAALISKRNVPTQLVWYLLVGGIALTADFVVFLTLLPAGLPVAVIVGFFVGTLVNYILSKVLAFKGGRFGFSHEIIRLFAVAGVGVALTLGLVLALTETGVGAPAAKAIATVIVFAWNYVGRRALVFGPDMPQGTWSFSVRSLQRLVRKDEADG
jgi:putative flippase GtrA